MKKIAIILKAVPGSGKSAFSNLLQRYAESYGISMEIFSTDSKFYNNGVYEFDFSKLREYHLLTFDEFNDALGEVEIVISDNTNLRAREYNPYIEAAKAAGYTVIGVVFEPSTADVHFERNVHNVPIDRLEKMIQSIRSNMNVNGVDEQFIIHNKDGSPESLYSECIIKAILS